MFDPCTSQFSKISLFWPCFSPHLVRLYFNFYICSAECSGGITHRGLAYGSWKSIHVLMSSPLYCNLLRHYEFTDLHASPCHHLKFSIPIPQLLASPSPHPFKLTTSGVPPLLVITQTTSSSLSLTSRCSVHAGISAQSPGSRLWFSVSFPVSHQPCP